MTKTPLTILCIAVLVFLVGCQKGRTVNDAVEKPSLKPETQSDNSDVTIASFWPASEKEYRIKKREIVVSRYAGLPGSKVLRLETELVVASFDIQDVIEYLDAYGHLERMRALAERLRKDSETRSQFCYADFSYPERQSAVYCIVHLLEQGKFIIRLRSDGQIVPEITVCEWSSARGARGFGGRAFCLSDERAFFWTMDWL